MTRGASAPGKALLCGEYAVLEGAPAIVASVDRRVRAEWCETQVRPLAPEVEATLERAGEHVGRSPGPLAIDVTSLYDGSVKLGLGSSAGASVAAAGAVFDHHQRDLASPAVRDAVFACAFEGHAAVAPSGSGVDVAASTYGGFLRFSREGTTPNLRALAPAGGLHLSLVWTGHPARTSDLVDAVRRFQGREPESHRRHLQSLIDHAERFADAFEGGAVADIIAEADAYGEAMHALGNAAGAPIVDASLARVRAIARDHGGAAKPSGAGGGDVAVAFFDDETRAARFSEDCRREGLKPVDVRWGVEGVRPHR